MTKTFMFLPAGVHTITPFQNKCPVNVKLEITPESAAEMQKQFEALKLKGQKPFIAETICVDGDKDGFGGVQKVAFFINRFFWKDDGVYCEGEQCCTDDTLIGKAVAATFYSDRISDTSACHVVCMEKARPCFGELKLVADVAFDNINPNFSVS
jgi:hypothetical protein